MGIHAPNSVGERLATRVHFRGDRSFVQVHDCTANRQIFVELILHVCSEQRLTLHGEQCLILQLHIHVRSRLQYGLVQYGYCSHGVVHGVVHVLYQRSATRSYHHTSAWHVHRVQANLIACWAFVFTHQRKLILLRVFLCAHQCWVIQLLEHILLRQTRIAYLFCQVATKWLQHGEDNPTRRGQCRVSFHIVKPTVRRSVVARIQSIQSHHANQLFAFDGTFHQVLHIGTHRVVAVLDIQFKLIATHLTCANRVDILHHQVPRTFVLGDGGVVATLQHLQQQRIRCFQRLACIGGELTHLIHLSCVGIFVCNGQHFVLVQCCFQRDVSQGCVQRVLAIAQQSCRLYLLIIFAHVHAC